MEQYAPCPKCGGTNASKPSFTWWGGLLGPKLLSHVKCGSCGAGYNGKSGKDNTAGIVIYCLVVGVICFFLFFFIFGIVFGAMYL